MKKLLLFFIFVTAFSNAQTINFPDANFKAKLLTANVATDVAFANGMRTKIDTNNDGNIQLSEAQAIDSLDVSIAEISDLTGIAGFTHLRKLSFHDNQVTAVDFSMLSELRKLYFGNNAIQTLSLALPNLEILQCFSNQLTAIDVSACTYLHELNCSYNHLTALNVSQNPNLYNFNCSNNALTTLTVSGLTNLQEFNCGFNQLTALDASGLTNMIFFFCDHNLLTSLAVANDSSLFYLQCEGNALTSLDTATLGAINTINCDNNNLSAMDFSGNPGLYDFRGNGNDFTTLDFSGLTNLYVVYLEFGGINPGHIQALNFSGCSELFSIYASYNDLTNINLSGCTALVSMSLGDNDLTTLDVSDCTSLEAFSINNNIALTSIYMKNGSNQSVAFGNNPNLTYICADESEISPIQDSLVQFAMPNVVINSYCSVAPGGNYNTITGSLLFDINGNGCDSSDAQPLLRIRLNDGTNNGAAFTNNAGIYSFYVESGNFTLTPEVENAAFFNISPASATINFADNNNNTTTQHFCMTPIGVHHDVEISIVPLSTARPGFDAKYELIYRNKGNQTSSGAITLAFADALLDVTAATPNADTIAPDLLTWNYANLAPFEVRKIDFVMNLNSPIEIPAVNGGDILSYAATITSVSGDEAMLDNNAALRQVVVNSFDPNDKICLEGNIVSPEKIGDYLHYTINFENTGTAAAENIVVKDMIDTAKFDIATLQVLNASHPVETKITDNKVEFIFENINLAAHEHGNVVFKIRTKSDLVIGDSVSNKADIYFDYNFPVETVPAVSVFQLLATTPFEINNSVTVFPNPATENITVKATENIESIQLSDASGRIVNNRQIGNAACEFDLSQITKGVYFLKIIMQKATKSLKIIKL